MKYKRIPTVIWNCIVRFVLWTPRQIAKYKAKKRSDRTAKIVFDVVWLASGYLRTQLDLKAQKKNKLNY